MKVTSKDLAATPIDRPRPIRCRTSAPTDRPARRRSAHSARLDTPLTDMSVGGVHRADHRRNTPTDGVRASRADSRARLAVVKALRCASTRCAGCGLDERLGRAAEGNYVMPGRLCPAAKCNIEPDSSRSTTMTAHRHAQHRGDDRSADAPLPRVRHDRAGHARRTVDAHALRRGAQGRGGIRRARTSLDTTKAATPSRLVLIDTTELGWQRARCRASASTHPADPVLVGFNTLQQWLWQRLQVPTAAHA